jgi:outer membrane protein assembly factor BamA
VKGSYECVGGELGGDFEFRKGVVDLRQYRKISRVHFLDLRVLGGAIDAGRRGGAEGEIDGFAAIPTQERFFLGGIGTMRATQFKSMQGDRMFLANAEVRVEVFHDFQAAIFADVGDAWVEEGEDFDLNTDAGIGFQDSDSSFRINFAKKMDRGAEDDIFISVRIRRMF